MKTGSQIGFYNRFEIRHVHEEEKFKIKKTIGHYSKECLAITETNKFLLFQENKLVTLDLHQSVSQLKALLIFMCK